MCDRITAVVLAAGAAKRMGEPKLLLPYRGVTVLNATLSAVEASRVDRVIVVTGSEGDAVESSINTQQADVVRNPDYRRGNMSSFLTATATDPDAAVFILVPGDLPTIRTETIDAMVGLWRDTRPWAAVTAYADRVAHPFLVSHDALDVAAPMDGDKVLGRLFIEPGDDRVIRLDMRFDAPRDVNTPEDYETLLRE